MRLIRHARWFFGLVFILSIFAACRVNEDNFDIVVTAPPEFKMDMFEERDPANGAADFGLWVERLEKSDCPGYGIAATVQVQGSDIRVTIFGVVPPAVCAGDSASAKQFLPIGNLADGTYNLHISLRDIITNEAVLTVANGRYILSLPNPAGIYFENFVLESLPDEGFVWGWAATPDESLEPVADQFIADLKTLTDDDGLPPGYYSYFTKTGAGGIFFHNRVAPSSPAELFVRKRSAPPAALKSLLQNYRNAAQQPLAIKCWTTEGEL